MNNKFKAIDPITLVMHEYRISTTTKASRDGKATPCLVDENGNKVAKDRKILRNTFGRVPSDITKTEANTHSYMWWALHVLNNKK